MSDGLAIVIVLVTFGFMVWAIVSLVKAIIRKVKAKKSKPAVDALDKEKGD